MAAKKTGSKKTKSSSENVRACPETRRSVGTPFVCHPRYQQKLNWIEPPKTVKKGEKRGLKSARKSWDDQGKGYYHQTHWTWGDWDTAVKGGDLEKANRIYRALKAKETRPKQQPVRCSMFLGELLAYKGIEIR